MEPFSQKKCSIFLPEKARRKQNFDGPFLLILPLSAADYGDSIFDERLFIVHRNQKLFIRSRFLQAVFHKLHGFDRVHIG